MDSKYDFHLMPVVNVKSSKCSKHESNRLSQLKISLDFIRDDEMIRLGSVKQFLVISYFFSTAFSEKPVFLH